jgi:hypothetical protein
MAPKIVTEEAKIKELHDNDNERIDSEVCLGCGRTLFSGCSTFVQMFSGQESRSR